VKARKLKNGYWACNIRRGPNDWETLYVHKMQAAAWLPPPAPGEMVRHLNGDKDDNTHLNLAHGDSRLNAQDCVRHGRTLKGERSPVAKLNHQIAFAMREAVKMGVTQRVVAEHFRVSPSTVSTVVAEKRWMPESPAAVASVAP
jgi:urease accessory protein UreH